jgi:hypothetical protein
MILATLVNTKDNAYVYEAICWRLENSLQTPRTLRPLRDRHMLSGATVIRKLLSAILYIDQNYYIKYEERKIMKR